MPGPQSKSITVTGATAVVSTIQFTKLADGSIQATVYGSASRTDGSSDTNSLVYTLNGAADTTVRNYMAGQALTLWRTQNGLEAP